MAGPESRIGAEDMRILRRTREGPKRVSVTMALAEGDVVPVRGDAFKGDPELGASTVLDVQDGEMILFSSQPGIQPGDRIAIVLLDTLEAVGDVPDIP